MKRLLILLIILVLSGCVFSPKVEKYVLKTQQGVLTNGMRNPQGYTITLPNKYERIESVRILMVGITSDFLDESWKDFPFYLPDYDRTFCFIMTTTLIKPGTKYELDYWILE